MTRAAALLLGMPEDAERERGAVGQLDRLDHVVRLAQPLARSPSPSRSTPWWWWDLTVSRSAPGRPRRERARLQPHLVVAERARGVQVVAVADRVGQVLDEGAAEGDVQQLHAAADAEHRHLALERGAGQRDLEGVALGPGRRWSRGAGSAP